MLLVIFEICVFLLLCIIMFDNYDVKVYVMILMLFFYKYMLYEFFL